MSIIRTNEVARAVCCYFMLTVAVMVFGATLAIAQADMIGIYFDQAATSNRFTTTETPELVQAWVCITNLSSPTGLWGFSCEGFANAQFCGMSIIGPQFGVCWLDWTFAAVPPLPNAPVLVVVDCVAVVPSPSTQVDLYIRPPRVPAPGQLEHIAYYYDNSGNPGALIPLHPVSGSYDVPVAVINEGAVADSQLPFGSIKLLFR